MEEFKAELAKMEVDVEALRVRLDGIGPHLEAYRQKQEDMKKKTGSDMGLFGRGWMVTDRGLGPDSGEAPLSRLAVNFTEPRFRSVPVPDVLFEFTMRIWYTYGMQFADPLANKLEVRRVTLTNTNEAAVVKIGNYYKNYTPLTLYNDDPWHARLKPTYHRQLFSDIEELSLTDQGPSWHMRGLSVRTRENWPKHQTRRNPLCWFLRRFTGRPLLFRQQARHPGHGDHALGRPRQRPRRQRKGKGPEVPHHQCHSAPETGTA
jgi:hypothetical protein